MSGSTILVGGMSLHMLFPLTVTNNALLFRVWIGRHSRYCRSEIEFDLSSNNSI